MESYAPFITLLGVGCLWAIACGSIASVAYAHVSNATSPESILVKTKSSVLLAGLFLAGALCCLIGKTYLGTVASAVIALSVDATALLLLPAARKAWKRRAAEDRIRKQRYAALKRAYSDLERKGDRLEARCAHTARTFDLTRKEEEILVHIASGKTYPEICRELVLSPNTVKTHARNIYRKIGAQSKEDVMKAVQGARNAEEPQAPRP